MIKIIKLIILIHIILPLTSFTSNQNECDKEIEKFMMTVLDSCAIYPLGGFNISKYVTEDFTLIGGELETTTFYIIENYWIEQIKDFSDERKVVTVKFSRLGTLTYSRGLSICKDILTGIILVKKEDNGKWKIDDIINRREFYLYDFQTIAYITSLLGSLKTYYSPSQHDDYYDHYGRPDPIPTLYIPLNKYFHINYIFSDEYLKKFTAIELQLLRNTIFALYGREFKTKWLQEYFNSQDWYSPNPCYSDSLLTINDIRNIKKLQDLERTIENDK